VTDQISFPPLHDPAPGELEMRKQHLLSEISRQPERARLSLSAFAFPRFRVAALSGAAVALAAGSAAAALVLSNSSGANAAPLLIQTTHGENWGEATVAGTAPTVTAPANSPPAAATAVSGGTPSEQALLRAVVAAVQPTAISNVEIVGSNTGVALHVTALDSSALTLWQESLVAAAFRDRAKSSGDNLSVRLFDGMSNGAALPAGPANPLPSEQPSDTPVAKQIFENAAARAGVPLDELTIYQPDGVAVAATLKSDDPVSFLLHQMPVFLGALRSQVSRFDGTYISLVDDGGQTVWETSWNGRISEGSVGSRSDLAGCSPVANWGPTPAPCPAS
jgi:hypothetical protein